MDKNGWISVKADKKPTGRVLVNLDDGTVLIGILAYDGWYLWWDEGKAILHKRISNRGVTHWMPLPEPPQS